MLMFGILSLEGAARLASEAGSDKKILRKELRFSFCSNRTCGAKRATLFAPIITESQQTRKTGKY
jgi:hypothetical protein